MNETTRKADVLILLVGSNPLPNYLAALVLRPKQILLFYSPETKMVKQSLQDTLRRRFPSLEMEERCIGDVTHAAEVREAFPPIQRSKVHLHYTGGTKIMAAHARMAFRDAGGTDAQASYLNERRGVLRFDDGYELDLAKQTLGLTLEEILSLHAIQSSDNTPKENAPTEDDAKALAQAVFQDPSLAQELYQIHRDEKNKTLEFKKAKGNAVELNELLPKAPLSIRRIPEAHWTKAIYDNWLKFLGGGWLEVWCGTLVRQVAQGEEVAVGLNCRTVGGRQFEMDVTLVQSHRLYAISCTTDMKLDRCKSKLFEVAMRARQLGGDLARSALVSLLHGSSSEGLFVDQLRNDVAALWDAPNTPQVFGLDDAREWISGRLQSLENWLKT